MRLRGLTNGVRQHFKYDGTSGGVAKRAYETEAGARRAATKHGKGYYLCTFCHLWHVGGTPKKVAS